jgi:hypothetical protein
VITLCDQGHVIWRCSNAGAPTAAMSTIERTVWQRTYQRGRPASEWTDPLAAGFTCVRSWPIHEPGWRREIVRADVACVH